MNEWILILTLTQQGANYVTAHIEDVQTTFGGAGQVPEGAVSGTLF